MDQRDSKAPVKGEVFRIIFDFLGKALTPIAILIVAFHFGPEISGLAARAKSASYKDLKIEFAVSGSWGDKLELNPVSLFYLMDAAKNPSSAWNADRISDADRKMISELDTKGLAKVSFTTRQPKDERDRQEYGTTEMTIKVTSKGIDFLKSIGLENIISPGNDAQ